LTFIKFNYLFTVTLKKGCLKAFDKLNLSLSDALRLFLRYVAENKKWSCRKFKMWRLI